MGSGFCRRKYASKLELLLFVSFDFQRFELRNYHLDNRSDVARPSDEGQKHKVPNTLGERW